MRWRWCGRAARPRWPQWCAPAQRTVPRWSPKVATPASSAAQTPDGSAAGPGGALAHERMDARARGRRGVEQTMVAEAGVTCWPRVQAAAAAAGSCCSRSALASEGSCTVGGNLARPTRAAPQVLRLRQRCATWCLGPRSRDSPTGGMLGWPRAALRKDNTGYDLQATCSSAAEGTLGIVTAATPEAVPPRPAAIRATAFVALRDPRAGGSGAARPACRARRGASLTTFELMNTLARARSSCCRHFGRHCATRWAAPAPWYGAARTLPPPRGAKRMLERPCWRMRWRWPPVRGLIGAGRDRRQPGAARQPSVARARASSPLVQKPRGRLDREARRRRCPPRPRWRVSCVPPRRLAVEAGGAGRARAGLRPPRGTATCTSTSPRLPRASRQGGLPRAALGPRSTALVHAEVAGAAAARSRPSTASVPSSSSSWPRASRRWPCR